MTPGRLDGVGVVVTRPKSAAATLAAALEREGARVWVFPSLAIEPLAIDDALARLLGGLARFDLAVFVSANAVEHGLAAAARLGPWPANVKVAAIGEATAAALRNSGFASVISPHERHDSEALLAAAEMQRVRGRRIIVFRGQGGREHLRKVLEQRGAEVAYAECYRRVRPSADPRPVAEALARGEVHAVSVLSAETLENFIAMIGPESAAKLAGTALVVPHEAVAAQREARRFARVLVASPGPEGLADALSSLTTLP